VSARHTPGPWFVGEFRHDGRLRVIGDRGDALVAYLAVGALEDEDARLIAAAPELLAALHDLAAWCKAYDFANMEHSGLLQRNIAAADAAIAKAEGAQ
jgi:hypothetical protein